MRGWTRRKQGKGFRYLDGDGKPLGSSDIDRIKSLVIPPAWTNVWICPIPNGHIQATGVDVAGRTQYLYHPHWRAKRDKMKFDRVLTAAEGLPKARKQIVRDLALADMPLTRAAATAVRLIDLGYFRIGSDAYADTNGSFGLTTLERRHVRRSKDGLVFHFVGKSGIEHTVLIDDEDAIAALNLMRNRRGGSARLLVYRDGRRWVDLDAASVNAYLATLFDGELTAKDFRTWHATVLAAAALAESTEKGDTKASRKRAVKEAVEQVATYLGNTPTVAKGSYIDPRVLDLYEAGTTIELPAVKSPTERQLALEKAVLALLAT